MTFLVTGCAASTAPAARPVGPAPATTPPPEDASCEEIADHVIVLLRESPEMQTGTDEERRANVQLLDHLHAELVEDCTARGWPAETRTCMMVASKRAHLDGCSLPDQAEASASEPTDIGECDRYIAEARHFSACDKLDASQRAALAAQTGSLEATLAELREGGEDVPPEALKATADACQAALEGLRSAEDAADCPGLASR
jgi:hypothetical protein